MSHRRPVSIGTALLAGSLLAIACEPVTAPDFPADGPPDALLVRVDGFGFGTPAVTLRGGDTLVVERRTDWRPDSAVVTRVVPTRDAWQAFWRAADAAGVRAWPRTCRNERVADGGGYTLDIVYAGGRVASQGTNSYPRRSGACSGLETTAEYRAFTAAVAALIGRPFP